MESLFHKCIFLKIPIENNKLEGNLCIPPEARGIVIFAHGSGSSRLSPRNQFVAQVLNQAGLATLLFDLLTEKEENEDLLTRKHRFDLPLLTNRLLIATDWIQENSQTKKLNIGYFGASTGAAAALLAAGLRPKIIKAVVSRGGRPDLAEDGLSKVEASTLLIVGGKDFQVIKLNEFAFQRLTCIKQLAIIPGARHLFEEPGALEEVAEVSKEWFKTYLS